MSSGASGAAAKRGNKDNNSKPSSSDAGGSVSGGGAAAVVSSSSSSSSSSSAVAPEQTMGTDKEGTTEVSIEARKPASSSQELNGNSDADGHSQMTGGGAAASTSSSSQLSALLSQSRGGNNSSANNGGTASPVVPDTMVTSGVVGGGNDNSQDDSSSTGAKDDEDEDDDDEEKLEGMDPEKLKAFNMFVRLFVDENLDRMVPISKQPKEKIQAIIDSCTRQFPEHADKARKRIRTYLKSCRRNKRTRDQAGMDAGNCRSAPHLTSVQAEHLLARACENEAENAKRMRMGLEPVSQPMPAPFTTTAPVDVLAAAAAAAAAAQAGGVAAAAADPAAAAAAIAAVSSSSSASPSLSVFPSISLIPSSSATGAGATEKHLKSEYKSEQLATLLAAAQQQQQPGKIATATAVPVSSIASFPTLNGNGAVPAAAGTAAVTAAPPTAAAAAAAMYRSSFQVAPNTFPGTAAILQQGQATLPTTPLQNGPTLEGLKKPPLLSHKLNTTEIGAVRQLITGYRESAAFLLRSADELEHLLQIQPKL